MSLSPDNVIASTIADIFFLTPSASVTLPVIDTTSSTVCAKLAYGEANISVTWIPFSKLSLLNQLVSAASPAPISSNTDAKPFMIAFVFLVKSPINLSTLPIDLYPVGLPSLS